MGGYNSIIKISLTLRTVKALSEIRNTLQSKYECEYNAVKWISIQTVSLKICLTLIGTRNILLVGEF